MKRLAIVLLIILVFFALGITPTRLVSRTFSLIYHTPLFFFRTTPPPAHSLKAAILNITTDFNELTNVLQEFLHLNPSVETSFREYLAHRATKSHPGLEQALDWVLSLYKIAFPFLIISLLTKLSTRDPPLPVGSTGSDASMPTKNRLLLSAPTRSDTSGGRTTNGTMHVHGSTIDDNAKKVVMATNMPLPVSQRHRLMNQSSSSPISGPGTPLSRHEEPTELHRQQQQQRM